MMPPPPPMLLLVSSFGLRPVRASVPTPEDITGAPSLPKIPPLPLPLPPPADVPSPLAFEELL